MIDLAAFRFISFDCYGTLIDWETGILGALRPWVQSAHSAVEATDRELLQLYARFEAEEEGGPYRTYRDVQRTVLERIAGELGVPSPDGDTRDLISDSVGTWPPFPDVVEALQGLAQSHGLVILSNIDQSMFAKSARLLSVEFTRVLTAEDIGSYKPNPRNFERLFAEVAPPGDILHVAQSLFHDHVPAKAAGMTTVWINRPSVLPGQGLTPEISGVTPRPDLVLPDLASLLTTG